MIWLLGAALLFLVLVDATIGLTVEESFVLGLVLGKWISAALRLMRTL
jgi:hypothetical protein